MVSLVVHPGDEVIQEMIMKDKNFSHCPLCQQKTFVLWRKEKFSLFQFPMEKPFPRIQYMPLVVWYCAQCVHAYLDPVPTKKAIDDFYSRHYNYYTSPMESQGLTRGIMEKPLQHIRSMIQKYYGKRKVKIADVGGSDGYSLYQLKDLASDHLLIEPSHYAAIIAQKYGIKTAEMFMNEKTANVYKGQFDVVISRHVIEHLEDPRAFMQQLLQLTRPGGIVIIETPDLQRILKDLLVRVLSLQHLHYFSDYSLKVLLRDVGTVRSVKSLEQYVLVSCIEKQKSQLILIRDKKEKYWIAQVKMFKKKLDKHTSILKKKISRWHALKKNIWLWGAGSAGSEISNVYGVHENFFRGYIDSDQRKASKRFVSAPTLPIMTPEHAHQQGVDCVVITSYSVKEIRQQIRRMKWKVEVIDIYGQRSR